MRLFQQKKVSKSHEIEYVGFETFLPVYTWQSNVKKSNATDFQIFPSFIQPIFRFSIT